MEINGLDKTASIDLPFFDGGWWSVMATVDYSGNDKAYIFMLLIELGIK